MMRGRVGKLIPQRITNRLLLSFPWLYKTRFVMYESYLSGSIPLLKECVSKTEGVQGQIMELGCARCGTTAILADHLVAINSRRKIYALDSFGEGLDPRDLQGEVLSGATVAVGNEAFHYNSIDYVREKLRKLGLEDRIILIKGFFSSTLPSIKEDLSLVLIDCDLGKTIDFCLHETFPKLSQGGMIVIDEYDNPDWSGVTPVVDDFVRAHLGELSMVSKGCPCVIQKGKSPLMKASFVNILPLNNVMCRMRTF